MPYVIINRFNDSELGLVTSAVTGPFISREEAEIYNQTNYPSPELNGIFPLLEAEWS